MKAIKNSPQLPFPLRSSERVVTYGDMAPNIQIHVKARGWDRAYEARVGKGVETLFFRMDGFVRSREEVENYAYAIHAALSSSKPVREGEVRKAAQNEHGNKSRKSKKPS